MKNTDKKILPMQQWDEDLKYKEIFDRGILLNISLLNANMFFNIANKWLEHLTLQSY